MFCLGQGMRSGPTCGGGGECGDLAWAAMVHCFTLAGLGLGGAGGCRAPWAFDVIRWVGVAYLLWLACADAVGAAQGNKRARRCLPNARFARALVVSLTNPKVILFVLAFVPQFVEPEAGPVLLQFLVFGAVIVAWAGFVINGTVVAHLRRRDRGVDLAGGGQAVRWIMWPAGYLRGPCGAAWQYWSGHEPD